ncbi:MAG TPA: hemerythrin domain-containing protein [Oscillatoriaceae cyanobacterium]
MRNETLPLEAQLKEAERLLQAARARACWAEGPTYALRAAQEQLAYLDRLVHQAQAQADPDFWQRFRLGLHELEASLDFAAGLAQMRAQAVRQYEHLHARAHGASPGALEHLEAMRELLHALDQGHATAAEFPHAFEVLATELDRALTEEEGTLAQQPKSQVQAEHRYQREVLRLLELALSSHIVPPAGHAFYRYLEEASTFFEQDLPRHIREEEMTVFPTIARHAPEVARLLACDHESLLDSAARFVQHARALIAEPSQHGWDSVASEARLLESMLKGHLAREEGAMRLPARGAY